MMHRIRILKHTPNYTSHLYTIKAYSMPYTKCHYSITPNVTSWVISSLRCLLFWVLMNWLNCELCCISMIEPQLSRELHRLGLTACVLNVCALTILCMITYRPSYCVRDSLAPSHSTVRDCLPPLPLCALTGYRPYHCVHSLVTAPLLVLRTNSISINNPNFLEFGEMF